MAYSTYEESAESRTPVELYEISIGSENYYLTSAEETYNSNGNDYEPLEGLKRGEIELSSENKQSFLKVELPASHAFAQKYRQIAPGKLATLRIFQIHRLDGATPERILQYIGSVQSVAFSMSGSNAEITLMPPFTLSTKTIPRDTFQRLCNNCLYGNHCKVAEASFVYTGTVSDVTGDTITVDGLNASKGAGWAPGGFITNALRDDYRMILGQSTDVLTVLIPFPEDITVDGEDFDVIAGCDHTLPTCVSKFSNGVNFRGFWYVSSDDPHKSGF